jgi:hypothetical protein
MSWSTDTKSPFAVCTQKIPEWNSRGDLKYWGAGYIKDNHGSRLKKILEEEYYSKIIRKRRRRDLYINI